MHSMLTESPSSSRRSSRLPVTAAFLAGLLVSGLAVEAQTLVGSKESMLRQNWEAQEHRYTYLRTSAEVREFAEEGLLVRVKNNSDFLIADDVSFPYTRPEVKVFLERFAGQYRDACGERLVVTSLTRPTTRQPSNASPLSVHPTGMAVDLRRSARPACRAWIEDALLTMENRGLVEATKENHPAHYHVCVFPDPYMTWVAANGGDALPARPQIVFAKSRASKKSSRSHAVLASKSKRSSKSSHASHAVKKSNYRVRGGDSLWDIAKKHGVSVAKIKSANRIRTSHLKPGQVLAIPAR